MKFSEILLRKEYLGFLTTLTFSQARLGPKAKHNNYDFVERLSSLTTKKALPFQHKLIQPTGIKLANQTSACGGLLIALGVIVTIASDSGSATSLIPAFIGAILLILGLLARSKPELSHHLMHAMAVVVLLAIIGSLGSLIGRGSTGWALFSQLATIAIAGFLLVNAIQAFKKRSQQTADES